MIIKIIKKYLLSRKINKVNKRGLEIEAHLMNMHNIIDFTSYNDGDYDQQ